MYNCTEAPSSCLETLKCTTVQNLPALAWRQQSVKLYRSSQLLLGVSEVHNCTEAPSSSLEIVKCTAIQKLPALAWIREMYNGTKAPSSFLETVMCITVQKVPAVPVLTFIKIPQLSATGCFFSLTPAPNLTKSQAHYKFLYLDNFRGGRFKLYRAWDLVKLGGPEKKPPCILTGAPLNCRTTRSYTNSSRILCR